MARTARPAALALLCLVLPAAARAGGDVFGGYSFERADARNRHGWNVSLGVGLSGPLALEADGSGHYGSKDGVDRDQLTLMGGARFSLPGGAKAAPFVHALAGLLRVLFQGRTGTTSRAMRCRVLVGAALRFGAR